MILLLGIPGGIVFLIWISFTFFLFAIWVWTLVDIIKSQFRDANEKLIWVLLVAFLPFIGTLLYYVFGSKNRI